MAITEHQEHSEVAVIDDMVKKQENDKEDKRKSLTTEEKAETGRVTFAVILAYCKACTWYMTVLVLLFNVVTNTFAVVTNFWLADWSNAAGNLNTGNTNVTVGWVTACDGAASVE